MKKILLLNIVILYSFSMNFFKSFKKIPQTTVQKSQSTMPVIMPKSLFSYLRNEKHDTPNYKHNYLFDSNVNSHLTNKLSTIAPKTNMSILDFNRLKYKNYVLNYLKKNTLLSKQFIPKKFPKETQKLHEIVIKIQNLMNQLKNTKKNSKDYFVIINKIILCIALFYWSRKLKIKSKSIDKKITEDRMDTLRRAYQEEAEFKEKVKQEKNKKKAAEEIDEFIKSNKDWDDFNNDEIALQKLMSNLGILNEKNDTKEIEEKLLSEDVYSKTDIEYYSEKEATNILNRYINEIETGITEILTNNILEIIPDQNTRNSLKKHFEEISKKNIKNLFLSLNDNTLQENLENVINDHNEINEELKKNLIKLTKKTIHKFKQKYYSGYHEAGHAMALSIDEPFKNIISINDMFKYKLNEKITLIQGASVSFGLYFQSLRAILGGLIAEIKYNNIPQLSKQEFIDFYEEKLDEENPNYKILKNIRNRVSLDLLQTFMNPYFLIDFSKLPQNLKKKIYLKQSLTDEEINLVEENEIKKTPEERMDELYNAYQETHILLKPYEQISDTLAGVFAVRQFNRGLKFLQLDKLHALLKEDEVYEIIESNWSLMKLKTIQEYQKE